MSDTSLHSHSGSWLKFSEAVLAHWLDAKHNKRAREAESGRRGSGRHPHLLAVFVQLSALPYHRNSLTASQPHSLAASCRAQLLLMDKVLGFLNIRLKAENILWQTENAPKTEEMNHLINSQKLMTLNDENGGKKKKRLFPMTNSCQ